MTTEKAFAAGSTFPEYKPGTVRVYSMRFCPFAQRARIVLNHKNIKYETVNINLARKPEWYLGKINPLGLVPTVQVDDKIVYDSAIVCEFVDAVFPGDKLVPDDPYKKALDKMLMERYSKIYGLVYRYLKEKDPAVVDSLVTFLDVLEQELVKRSTTFFGGDKPMLIDFLIWPHIEKVVVIEKMEGKDFLSSAKFPRFSRWIDAITKVPAVKNTTFPLKTHEKIMASAVKGLEYFDYGLEE